MYLIVYHFIYIVLLQLDTCENKIKTIEIDYCVAHTIIAIQFPNKGVTCKCVYNIGRFLLADDVLGSIW